MSDLVINSSIQHTLLILVPLLFTVVLKMARLRGWSMFGGVLGGILLGPAVLGSISPEHWETLFQGGGVQRMEMVQLQRQQEADLIAATTMGADEALVLQMRADHQFQLSLAQEEVAASIWTDQRSLRNYGMALIVLILFSGSLRCRARGNGTREDVPLGRRMGSDRTLRAPYIDCIDILGYRWNEHNCIVCLALQLAHGRSAVGNNEQQICRKMGVQLLMLRCGRVAWIAAASLAVYATWQVQGIMSLVWMLPLLLLPISWAITPTRLKWLTLFVDYVAIPSIMTVSIVLIDPLYSLQFWPILVVILLCADSRWLGGMIGLCILGDRKSIHSMRLSIPLVDAGVSQLCMATLLFCAGVLPAPLTLAALVGALFLEITAPIRFTFATKQH